MPDGDPAYNAEGGGGRKMSMSDVLFALSVCVPAFWAWSRSVGAGWGQTRRVPYSAGTWQCQVTRGEHRLPGQDSLSGGSDCSSPLAGGSRGTLAVSRAPSPVKTVGGKDGAGDIGGKVAVGAPLPPKGAYLDRSQRQVLQVRADEDSRAEDAIDPVAAGDLQQQKQLTPTRSRTSSGQSGEIQLDRDSSLSPMPSAHSLHEQVLDLAAHSDDWQWSLRCRAFPELQGAQVPAQTLFLLFVRKYFEDELIPLIPTAYSSQTPPPGGAWLGR